jgi:methylenetetrahydrofolate dehydrogenase (NADP+) / methenyltetrahydrofolate cyclohydrolase
MKFIDGKAIAAKIEADIKQTIQTLSGRPPGLAFILVGNNPASRAYVNAKKKRCAEVGILSIDHQFPEDISETKLLHEIAHLNANPAIDGILVQLPLPSSISAQKVMEAISPDKDVDGFHPINVGKMLIGETDGFFPCTPYGIVTLLKESQISVEGKHVVIIGRSNIVGKPLAALLMQKTTGCNATVTVAHSYSHNLASICQSADILIAAIGRTHFITREMIKPGAVVIDVGQNRLPDKTMTGDVDFDQVAPLTSFITPVPGGVGPMTIAMLLSNTLRSYQQRLHL